MITQDYELGSEGLNTGFSVMKMLTIPITLERSLFIAVHSDPRGLKQ